MANQVNTTIVRDDEYIYFGTSGPFRMRYSVSNTRLELTDTAGNILAHWTDAGTTGNMTVTGAITTNTLSLTNGQVVSGDWTPTLTDVANAGTLDSIVGRYIRVGSMVTVAATFRATITANATLTQVRATLPIASNFTSVRQCSGAGTTDSGAGASITPVSVASDATNDAILLSFLSPTDSNLNISFTATYVIV